MVDIISVVFAVFASVIEAFITMAIIDWAFERWSAMIRRLKKRA